MRAKARTSQPKDAKHETKMKKRNLANGNNFRVSNVKAESFICSVVLFCSDLFFVVPSRIDQNRIEPNCIET